MDLWGQRQDNDSETYMYIRCVDTSNYNSNVVGLMSHCYVAAMCNIEYNALTAIDNCTNR